jgi:hypothetical protein
MLLFMSGILLIGGGLLWVHTQRQPAEDTTYQEQLAALQKLKKIKKHHPAAEMSQQVSPVGQPGTAPLNVSAPGEKTAVAKLPDATPTMPSVPTGTFTSTATSSASNSRGTTTATTRTTVAGTKTTVVTKATTVQSALLPNQVAQQPVVPVQSSTMARLSGSAQPMKQGVAPVQNVPFGSKLSAQQNIQQSGGQAAAPQAVAPQPNKNVAATNPQQAQIAARENAGRQDPFKYVSGYKPFPRASKEQVDSLGDDTMSGDDSGGPKFQNFIQHTKNKIAQASKKQNMLVPPPPPMGESLAPSSSGYSSGLPIDELPAPPTRPSIADKMKLVGVIGDRAIFKFSDNKSRMDNKWPKTITLAPGQKFESVSLVNVADTSVTLDEDGERSVKSLDPIK